MAADDKRDTPVPVKKGTAGPARRVPTATASGVSRKTPEELDERQNRMREVRRRGRQLGAGRAPAAALAVKPAVPPTDADDEGEQ